MARSSRSERPFAERRREAGLDLYIASARLRVHPQYLRALELGHGPLSYALAQRMAAAYGTTLQALTGPAGAGGTGTTKGREASGNVSRPAGSAREGGG